MPSVTTPPAIGDIYLKVPMIYRWWKGPSTELVQKAHKAIDTILEPPSELLELWEEIEMVDEWKLSVLDLKARVIL